MRRLLAFAGTCVLAVGMLTACANAPGNAGAPPPGSSQGTGAPSASADATTPEQLVGTWVTGVRTGTPTQPFLTIVDDGTWRGSDGCNGVQGTWELPADGRLDVTAGPSTLIYCDGKPLPALFTDAASASVRSGKLTLTDSVGKVTATLEPGREELKKPD
jgi:heat shock protein HslJ